MQPHHRARVGRGHGIGGLGIRKNTRSTLSSDSAKCKTKQQLERGLNGSNGYDGSDQSCGSWIRIAQGSMPQFLHPSDPFDPFNPCSAFVI